MPAYIYRCYMDDKLLYIGQTIQATPSKRIAQHKGVRWWEFKTHHTEEVIFSRSGKLSKLEMDALAIIENNYIFDEQPLFNIDGIGCKYNVSNNLSRDIGRLRTLFLSGEDITNYYTFKGIYNELKRYGNSHEEATKILELVHKLIISPAVKLAEDEGIKLVMRECLHRVYYSQRSACKQEPTYNWFGTIVNIPIDKSIYFELLEQTIPLKQDNY